MVLKAFTPLVLGSFFCVSSAVEVVQLTPKSMFVPIAFITSITVFPSANCFIISIALFALFFRSCDCNVPITCASMESVGVNGKGLVVLCGFCSYLPNDSAFVCL
jgi:hypothetical protein